MEGSSSQPRSSAPGACDSGPPADTHPLGAGTNLRRSRNHVDLILQPLPTPGSQHNPNAVPVCTGTWRPRNSRRQVVSYWIGWSPLDSISMGTKAKPELATHGE